MVGWRKPKIVTVEVPCCECAEIRAIAERALALAENPQAQLDSEKAAQRVEAERRRGQFRGV